MRPTLIAVSVLLPAVPFVGYQIIEAEREQAGLQDALESNDDIEEKSLARRQVSASTEVIVNRFCDGHLAPSDAVEEVVSLVSGRPAWLEQARSSYKVDRLIPAGATDRDVIVCYLRIKLNAVRELSEARGDTARAAVATARIKKLSEELNGSTHTRTEAREVE